MHHLLFLLLLIWMYLTHDIYPTPPLGQDMTQGQFFFKRSLTGLNSEFYFSLTSCLTKAEEPRLPYYLPIGGGRIIGFIPFPRVLVRYEMQSVSSRIWTRVAVSISCDGNHYTTGTSKINVSDSLWLSFLCLLSQRWLQLGKEYLGNKRCFFCSFYPVVNYPVG